MTVVAFGAVSLAVATIGTSFRRQHSDDGETALDLVFGGAALATLGTWVVATYDWNIAKFGRVELDAVGPTTSLWPVAVILLATLLPLSRTLGRLARAALGILLAFLVVEIVLSLAGAVRDGSVSSRGAIVGVLYVLELGILATWAVAQSRRSTSPIRP
jgi:hypothetical protein